MILQSRVRCLLCLMWKNESIEEPSVVNAYEKELNSQTAYALNIETKLVELRTYIKINTEGRPVNTTVCETKLPNLQCVVFSGENTNSSDFVAFITQFKNVVGCRTNLSNSAKLTYLISYLKGYAFKVLKHLEINGDNYEIALNLLETEFLNKNGLIDDLYKRILSSFPKFDPTYAETKLYINEIRSILSDLKHYERDILNDISSNEFISHIVFNKLPIAFKEELVRKINNNYPDIAEIFENYVDIVRTLNMRTENNNKF